MTPPPAADPAPPVGRIALAVMAKVPVAGQVKTRLCPPLTPDAAAALARCFLLDRLDQLRGVPGADALVAFAPPEEEAALREIVPPETRLVPQVGADLGGRLDRLLTGLLAEGYPGAIALDADSPTLPTAYLREACQHLRNASADVVLGPCEDGGYYLIGLRAPAPALFVEVPWSTAAVLAETITRARDLGRRLRLLPPWFDVDRGEDLDRLHASDVVPGAFRPARTLAYLAGATGP